MAEKAAEKAYELGHYYEKTYRGCSQCAVAALQDVFNIRNDDIFKAATGLAGGSALCCEGSCGAYVGALLVLSHIVGRERDKFDDPEGVRFTTHKLSGKLRQKFIDEYGSIICRNIQTKVMGRYYYLADPQEFEKFHNAGAHDIYCPKVVGNASKWMTEIIQEAKLASPAK